MWTGRKRSSIMEEQACVWNSRLRDVFNIRQTDVSLKFVFSALSRLFSRVIVNSHMYKYAKKTKKPTMSARTETPPSMLASNILQPISKHYGRYLAIGESSGSAPSGWAATFPGTHRGHWLEGPSSQSAVYQRSGTGNQSSNAVSARSLRPWSTPRRGRTRTEWPTCAGKLVLGNHRARRPTRRQRTAPK